MARLLRSSTRKSRSLATVLLWLLIILYAVHFGALSTTMHDSFLTHAADLGNMDQPIWNTLHGHWLQETKKDGSEGTRLSDHFEPIFLPVSLVFLVWDDVRALLWLQTLALALGAIPVYWIAKDAFARAGLIGMGAELWGLGFAAVYLLFPALEWANITEFHAVPLAVTPLLLALHFAHRRRDRWMWLFSILAMSTQEHIPLLTLMLGLYIALAQRRPRVGLPLALVSLAWFGVATFLIIPRYAAQAYHGQATSVYFRRFGELGNSPADIARSLLTNPALALRIAIQPARLTYLTGLLTSVGFVALLDPLTLLIAAPTLGINVLSAYYAQFSGRFHYSAPIVPIFIVAATFGALRLAGWLAARSPSFRKQAPRVVLGVVLMSSLAYHHRAGVTPLAASFRRPQVTEHHRLLARFAGQIPASAPLSATAQLFPHFTHRQRIHIFPTVADAEYVLLDVTGMNEMHPADLQREYEALVDGGAFGILDAADGYILLQRRQTGRDTLPDAFFDFARAQSRVPQYVTNVTFGDSVRLLGFDADVDPWGRAYTRTYWQALRPLAPTDRPWPFLVDDTNAVLEDTSRRPPVATTWYPPEVWQTGETVVVETLPWDAGDRLWVAAGFLHGDSWEAEAQRLPVRDVEPGSLAIRRFDGDTWVRLALFVRRDNRLQIDGELRLWDLPAGAQPLDAQLGDAVAVRGFEVRCTRNDCTPGNTMYLTVYWQALRRMDANYTVFAHLVTPDGQIIIAQADRQPQDYAYPTRWWAVGEIVSDMIPLDVPGDALAGPYRLRVGLYRAETGERLPITAGPGQEGAVDLGPQP